VDDIAFQLLMSKFDDLKGEISLLRDEVKEVKSDVKSNTMFKWKLSGVALVLTILFQGLLAWIQRGTGQQ
jgi:hypothetical protein